ncbi:MAG: hypothetical protein GX981_02740 [Tissierellia bacterium]|nr:hypothetical protein [Tissierellia bacterium]
MEKLEDTKKYNHLEINGVIFERIQIFIRENYIELVDSWGKTSAKIYKRDIKTVNI